jgi:hypothetical protein
MEGTASPNLTDQTVTIEMLDAEIATETLTLSSIPSKNVAGQPCGFCQNHKEILLKTKQYFEECKGKFKMPFVEELALELDYNEDTLIEWIRYTGHEFDLEHKEYSAAYAKLKTLQKLRLQQRILGRYNPRGGIFLLTVNHGMIESDKRIVASENNKPLEIVIVEEGKISS